MVVRGKNEWLLGYLWPLGSVTKPSLWDQVFLNRAKNLSFFYEIGLKRGVFSRPGYTSYLKNRDPWFWQWRQYIVVVHNMNVNALAANRCAHLPEVPCWRAGQPSFDSQHRHRPHQVPNPHWSPRWHHLPNGAPRPTNQCSNSRRSSFSSGIFNSCCR